jgi:hypothetical protein
MNQVFRSLVQVSLPLATDILCGIHAALKRCGLPVPGFVGKYFDRLVHRKGGLMHHSVAALLPNATDIERVDHGEDVHLQELLNGLDELEID